MKTFYVATLARYAHDRAWIETRKPGLAPSRLSVARSRAGVD